MFRLNFSHGTHDDHHALFEAIRQAEAEHSSGRPIGILADLQGPKLRLGDFAEGKIELEAKAPAFRLDLNESPPRARRRRARAPLPHPEIFEALEPGTELLLDDGKVRLQAETCGAEYAETLNASSAGALSNHKGMNVLRTRCHPAVVGTITEKDRADIAFAFEQGADWIALSALSSGQRMWPRAARSSQGAARA